MQHLSAASPAYAGIDRWQIEGRDTPAVAVFETDRAGWVGVTTHKPDEAADLERQSRKGERVWGRE
ncbi:MAG TPA: hypothetical protein ENI99_02585 [Sedimenticola sp.]|nr:hypothetical protein [Sedimenticola sp.]